MFEKTFVEVLHRPDRIKAAIQAQHPLDLRLRGAAQRRMQPTVFQTGHAVFPVTIPPPAKCPLADPKQFGGLHLAQLGSLRPAKSIFEAHKAYPFVKPSPVHPNPLSIGISGPDTSRATNTGHFTS